MIDNENSTNLSVDSLQALQIKIVWGFLSGPRDRQWDHMGSRVVMDQQALATGCVHWKRTVPHSNVVQKTAQTICTGYKENIVVLESGYFFDYLCHWNWFLLSLLIFILFLHFFLIRRGGCHWQRTASGPKSHIGRSKTWHWQGRKVTQGPKCHIGVL